MKVVDHPGILEVRDAAEGVSLLTLLSGTDGAPFVLSEKVLDALESAFDALATRGLRGLLVASDHPTVFCAGADVEAMANLRSAAEAEAIVRRGQRIFDVLARLSVQPVVVFTTAYDQPSGAFRFTSRWQDFRLSVTGIPGPVLATKLSKLSVNDKRSFSKELPTDPCGQPDPP